MSYLRASSYGHYLTTGSLSYFPGDLVYAVIPHEDYLYQVVCTLGDYRSELVSCDPADVHVQSTVTERRKRDIPNAISQRIYATVEERDEAIVNGSDVRVHRITGFDIVLHEQVKLPFEPKLHLPLRHIVERVPSYDGYKLRFGLRFPFRIGQLCSFCGVSEIIGQTVTDIVKSGGIPVYFVKVLREKSDDIIPCPNEHLETAMAPFKKLYPHAKIVHCLQSKTLQFAEPHNRKQNTLISTGEFGKNYQPKYLKGLHKLIENVTRARIKRVIVKDSHWFSFTCNETFISASNETHVQVSPKKISIATHGSSGLAPLSKGETIFIIGKNSRNQALWFRGSSLPGFSSFYDLVKRGDITREAIPACKLPDGEDSLWSLLLKGYLNPRISCESVEIFKRVFLWNIS